MPTVIGIDLGTTFSCVGIYRHGNVEIIVNELGGHTTPSYVAFSDKGKLVGDAARSQAGSNPKNTVFDTKRLIGRKFTDNSVREDMEYLPFEVIDEDGNPKVKVMYKGKEETFAPEQISALILEKMKTIAEIFLNKPIDGAVITVPAYFNDAQRRATQQAGKLAGLNVMRIINEPTAAAIAYGFQNLEYEATRHILVFDVGGGTLDVTILKIDEKIFEAKSTSGDTHLGGEDFTNRMVNHIIQEIKTTHGKDITGNAKARTKLRKACEKAKRSLSQSNDASIKLETFIDGDDFETTISRAKFEQLNEDLFQKILHPIQIALDDAGLNVDEIDDVVLVGGSTRIPKIQNLLKEFFKETKINKDINPDEAVAFGAAVQAAKVAGDESDELQEVVILDITPLSLGIETKGGLMASIIPKNTSVPMRKSKEFTTPEDNLTSILLTVYEGERPLTKDNNKLGEFILNEITPAPVGNVKIDVKFEIDENGTLDITATERDTTNAKGIQINTDSYLNYEKVAEMIQRAEQFRLEDELERQRVQAKVDLESLCIVIQSDFKRLRELSQEDESDRNQVLAIVAQTQSWIATHRKEIKEEYELKQAEVEKTCNAIRKKIFDE